MLLTVRQVAVFALMLARLAGLFVAAPILNARTFPTVAKMAMATWIAVLFWFVVPVSGQLPQSAVPFVMAVVVEFMIGLLLGFASDLIVTAVEFGGSLMDSQMGMSVGQTLDPMSGTQTTIIARLLRWMTTLMFLAVGGHHMLMSAIYQSFKLLPVGQPVYFAGAAEDLVTLAASMFAVGTQLAMPIILVIFFLDFSLGMISRVAPQVNVFQLGFEIKPTLGGLIFVMMTPFMLAYVSPLIERTVDNLLMVMRHMQVGG